MNISLIVGYKKGTYCPFKEADKRRREEFKKYEMEKKFEKEHRLNAINDTQVTSGNFSA